MLGTLILVGALHLWQFWVSIACFSLGGGAMIIGSAFITDLVPAEKLGSILTRYTSSLWIAGTLGFGGTGFIIRAIGLETTFALVSVLPLIAAGLIFSVRPSTSEPIAEPA